MKETEIENSKIKEELIKSIEERGRETEEGGRRERDNSGIREEVLKGKDLKGGIRKRLRKGP